jgi:hypothetical protein
VVYYRYLQGENDRQVLEWLDQQVIERLIPLQSETDLERRLGNFLAGEIRQIIDEYERRGED